MIQMARTLSPILRLFLKEHGKALTFGALLAAATVLAGIGLLGLSGWFITATAFAGLAAVTAITFDVFAPSAGIRLLAIGRTAARYGERLVTHDATLSVLASLRERLFRGWARPGAAALLRRRPAKLLFRLTADIDALDALYLRVLIPAGVAILSAIAVGLMLGLLDPLFGLVAALWLIATGLAIPVIAGRLALKPSRRRAHAIEALRSRTIDLVAGQTDLLMAGRLAGQRAAVSEADRRLADADDALNRIDSATAAAFGLSSTLILTASLLAVAALSEAGAIGTPAAVFALLTALAATEPFAALRRGALELGRTLIAARRIAPSLAAYDGRQAERPAPPHGMALALTTVTARHAGAARPALSGVTLSVRTGERLAIVGTSGAGKSTLLALIAGELPPESGSCASLTATTLTQRTELFQDTLRGNLTLAAPAATDGALHDALDAAGLRSTVAALPHGLDTRLGEGGAGLSGGQSRRLALARLFLRDTPVWLLDEPTDGLDAATARDVLSRLDAEAHGVTLVIATHIRREAMLADRIAVMDHGRIVAAAMRGTVEFDGILARLRPD